MAIESARILEGTRSISNAMQSMPLTTLFHYAFRTVAFVIYFTGYAFFQSFVTVFVIVVLLSALDFWVVKNVTGRLMVGMRWWNFVDENGDSRWVFENRQNNSSFADPPSSGAKAIFWFGLVSFALLWSIMTVVNFFAFHWGWMTLTCFTSLMTSANAVGYVYCLRDSSNRMQTFTSAVKSSLMNSIASRISQG